MKIGLFFGSFNPIHSGHLIIANIMVETTDLEKIWFVVSPQNPFKKRMNLAHEMDRYDMVQAAVYDNYHFQVSDIEFSMPRPSYTIDTLAYLSDKYPNHQFKLIIGEDNLLNFNKWKNADVIMNNYGLYVYPRPGVNRGMDKQENESIRYVDAPVLDISATFIRNLIKNGQSIKYLVPDSVEALIRARKLYY